MSLIVRTSSGLQAGVMDVLTIGLGWSARHASIWSNHSYILSLAVARRQSLSRGPP